MGAGLANQIRSKYPNVYKDYKRLCAEQGDDGALRSCFEHLKQTVTNLNEENSLHSIAIPYGIGCGLAGGDWTVVREMMEDVLGECEVT